MKLVALAVAFQFASRIALAQGAADPAPPPRAPDSSGGWIISETTSPVNYTPIVTATAFSSGPADGSSMQLSIYCRGGRTELVVSGPALSGSGTDYALSYRLDAGRPVQVTAGMPSFGAGAAFRGDVVALLQSLPEAGVMAIRLAARAGAIHEAHFSLSGSKAARDRVALACKWPQAAAGQRHE